MTHYTSDPPAGVPSTSEGLDGQGGNRHADGVDESQQWVEFGRWLVKQREEHGLRRRDAARRAKVSETLWRDLETGRKEAIGAIRLLPNPSADVLERVAGALDLPVDDVLARIGRPAHRPRPRRPSRVDSARSEEGALLAVKLRRLSERDRAVVERLVDAMLEHDEAARPRNVRFGIFYELQLPRPWDPGAEHRLVQDSLEQIELADRLGFDYLWEVEHHFLEEYSHSSAPEVLLAAASQRTRASASGTASSSSRWATTTRPGWRSASPPSTWSRTVGPSSARGSRAPRPSSGASACSAPPSAPSGRRPSTS